MMTNEQLYALSIKAIYRLLIKNVRSYPSVNRFDIYKEIKETFRTNRNLEHAESIKREKKKAIMGVAHMMMYNDKSQELIEKGYNTKAEYETLNPKDENYIYF